MNLFQLNSHLTEVQIIFRFNLPNHGNFIVSMPKWKTQAKPDWRQNDAAQEEQK